MKSIRHQLTLSLLLGFALLLGAGGVAVYCSARAGLYREFDNGLRLKALAIAALTRRTREGVRFEFRDRLQPTNNSQLAIDYYQLYARHGDSLERAPLLGQTNLPPRFGSLTEPTFFNLELPGKVPGRAVGLEFVVKQRNRKAVREDEDEEEPAAKPATASKPAKQPSPALPPLPVGLVVAAERTALDHTLRALANLLGLAGGASLLATIGLIAVALRRGLRPLDQLAGRAERIDAASLQTRFPADGLPAELTPIAQRLNELLSRLQAAFERERRFSADLAHELRTPLAELRSLAEVKLRCGNPADHESFRETLDIAIQMQSLVTRLLALARSEQRDLPLQAEPVEINRVLESVWEKLRPRADRHQLAVKLAVPPPSRIVTDAALFRGILQNLLANAVDYTPPQGALAVQFVGNNNHFELTIRNTTAKLEAADLPHLFDRFWRKDSARTDSAHSGLGLALARSFAELLGMQLSARLESNGQFVLTLSGPLKAGPEPQRGSPEAKVRELIR